MGGAIEARWVKEVMFCKKTQQGKGGGCNCHIFKMGVFCVKKRETSSKQRIKEESWPTKKLKRESKRGEML